MPENSSDSTSRVAFDLMREIASAEKAKAIGPTLQDAPKYFFNLYAACRMVVNGQETDKALEKVKERL
jgi:hypothetical protein